MTSEKFKKCGCTPARLVSMDRKSQGKQQGPGKQGKSQAQVLQEAPRPQRKILNGRHDCQALVLGPSGTRSENDTTSAVSPVYSQDWGFWGEEKVQSVLSGSTQKLASKKKRPEAWPPTHSIWALLGTQGLGTSTWLQNCRVIFSECWYQGRV